MITDITIVEDFFLKKKVTFFHNNSKVFIKGFCFQRCYWGPHIPWQTSASQSRHQRYFPLAIASVTCPLEKQNQKCFSIHCDAGNQSILWPWMNKHCVINAFIQKWEMFCFIWFIEPTRLSSSLSPMYSQGKPMLYSDSFFCKLWNGDEEKPGLRLWPILQIIKWEKHAFQKTSPPVLAIKTVKVSEKNKVNLRKI